MLIVYRMLKTVMNDRYKYIFRDAQKSLTLVHFLFCRNRVLIKCAAPAHIFQLTSIILRSTRTPRRSRNQAQYVIILNHHSRVLQPRFVCCQIVCEVICIAANNLDSQKYAARHGEDCCQKERRII